MPDWKISKRKICFVGNCQSVHLRRWIKYFEDKSAVYVISSSRCDHERCTYYEDLVPDRWKSTASIPRIGFLISSIFLYKYLRCLKIDLAHIHFLGSFGTRLGRYLVFLNFRPLVVSTWGSDVVGLQDEQQKSLRSYVLQKADLITATSNFLAEETRKIAPGVKRIEVVPFGVDLEIFDPARFKNKKADDKILRIGFFKHLKPIYGPDYLIKAFSKVTKKIKNAELFLAGDGELRTGLEELSKKLGIHKKAHFLGFVENVPEIMASMDITVMPSLREAFGVASIESEALQVPVVAVKVGGVPEAVKDGITGLLVPPRDEKTLAEAMIKLLSDRTLREKMGKAGRKLVESKYNWEDNAGRMSDLYAEVLGEADV